MKKLSDDEYSYKIILYRLLYNCELMYDYLTETGKVVPEWVGNSLTSINLKSVRIKKEFFENHKGNRFTKESEFDLESKISQCLEQDKQELTKIFNELTKLTAPATPCSLENTIPSVKLFVKWGPKFMPFIRDIWAISIVCLLGYVICGSINVIYQNNMWCFQLLLMFSAALGACFYSLNTAKRYVIARTFDNKYIAHYYNRIIVGVIAGIILANIIKISYFEGSGTDAGSKIVFQMTPSLFALLGGFSAEAVVRILNRLVAMLATLVQGETKDIIEAKEQELKSKFEADRIKQNLENASKLLSIVESSALKADAAAYSKAKELVSSLMDGK